MPPALGSVSHAAAIYDISAVDAYRRRFAAALPGGMAMLDAAIADRAGWSLQAAFDEPVPSARWGGERDLTWPQTLRRFDALGPMLQCPASLLKSYGKAPCCEKHTCGVTVPAQGDAEACVVISLGSNNEFSFELDVARQLPHCAIHTLDCTIVPHVPAELRGRLTFHEICLGPADEEIDAGKVNGAGALKARVEPEPGTRDCIGPIWLLCRGMHASG
jgi:hypothetical protein